MTRASLHLLLPGAVLFALALQIHAPPARADTLTVYKCRTPQGQVIFQGTPCARGQQQQTMEVDADASEASPPPAPSTPTPQTPQAMAMAPPPPPTPPTTLYRCVRATDQTTYESHDGNPQPYYAPLAMTGIVPTPLGHITPGLKANAAMVASHYVLVQDHCAPMTVHDTCASLRDQYDENERNLSRAFKSDQPPLLEREKELLGQLSHC
ncbi:DUF4124 domain-containing protein [Dyella monticola]|nr:DUF4124 domain-containing protein [Dyella monticola]